MSECPSVPSRTGDGGWQGAPQPCCPPRSPEPPSCPNTHRHGQKAPRAVQDEGFTLGTGREQLPAGAAWAGGTDLQLPVKKAIKENTELVKRYLLLVWSLLLCH